MRWKKIVGWTIATLALLILVGAVGGCLYLKSSAFEHLAISKIVAQANQSTGGQSSVGALQLSLSPLTAKLSDITLRGKEPDTAPPLLHIDELTVGITVQSILQRKFTLRELLIDHPVARLVVDKQGHSNLPQPRENQSQSHTSLFDLAIGHFALTRGELYYNDVQTPIDASIDGLKANSTFESLTTEYRGSISYDNGQLHYGSYAAMPHSLNSQFQANPSQLSLDSLELQVASSTVQLHADLKNYGDPVITGNYNVLLHTQDFASMSPSVRPAGDVALTGTIHYQNDPNVPVIRNVVVDGRINSAKLTALTPQARADLRALSGTYRLANGTLSLPQLNAETLGGRIRAEGKIEHLDATPNSHIQATMRDISVRALRELSNPSQLKGIALSGSLNGNVDMAWTGPVSNIRARSDLTIQAAGSARHSESEVPINAVIHANYDGPQAALGLHQTFVKIPGTTLTAEGTVSKQSRLQLAVTSSDLHQLEMIAASLMPNTKLPVLAGAGNLNATVQGSMQRPQVSGQLVAQNLSVQGSDWKTAQVSFRADPSSITLSNGLLTNARKGRASFNGCVMLRDWSYQPDNSLSANLSVQQMPISDLERLANVKYPVSGELSGNIALGGSQLNPAGHGNLQIKNAVVYDEPLETFAADFHTEGKSVASEIKIAAPAGDASANLTYTPSTKAYDVHLDAPHIVLEKLRAIQMKGLPLNGVVTVSASGQGTVDDPHLTASIHLARINLQQQSISDIKADLRIANKQADLTFDSQVDQAPVRGHAHLALSGDYPIDAKIDTASLPLNVLLAMYKPVPQGFQGQAELHATLKGPLKDTRQLEGHLTIPTLNVSYQSLQLGEAAPIKADLVQSVLTLRPAEIRGTGTSLRVQASIPVNNARSASFTASGSIDAKIVRIVSPNFQSSGTVLLDVHNSGKTGSPIEGQVRLQNIAANSPDLPLGVEKLNGTIDLDSSGLRTSDLTAQVGGGQASARGNISFSSDYNFNLSLQAQSIRLRYPDGLRTVLNGNLNWSGDRNGSLLGGKVLIGALSFTPDFDLASFSSQLGSSVEVPSQPGFADTIHLQLAVQSSGNLNATSSQVSIQGNADLQVTGTAQNPVITGRTNLTSGELFYRNTRYQLQRGIITFNDPNQTKPVLNISVTTTVEQYNLTLTLRGPFDMLTTAYTSDPPLATADIINLIARGQTTSESAATPTSSDSIIASQAAGQVSGSIQQLAGLSSLQIDPLFGGNSQDPSARVGIQQRVTKNFLFTFSTDVTQPGSEIVQGDYQINKRWSVSVARDQLGGVSVDGRFHTQF